MADNNFPPRPRIQVLDVVWGGVSRTYEALPPLAKELFLQYYINDDVDHEHLKERYMLDVHDTFLAWPVLFTFATGINEVPDEVHAVPIVQFDVALGNLHDMFKNRSLSMYNVEEITRLQRVIQLKKLEVKVKIPIIKPLAMPAKLLFEDIVEHTCMMGLDLDTEVIQHPHYFYVNHLERLKAYGKARAKALYTLEYKLNN